MSASERRERARAERHQLILTTARELAEAEGWDAVTTRRLADLVEYSQPVLYSHFSSRDELVREVALEGFRQLAAHLGSARQEALTPEAALRAVGSAYLNFAASRPALYQAMFVLPTDLKFASDETPAPLRAAFDEFVAVLRPYGGDPELKAEVAWGALHGFAVLTRAGRIPPSGREARLNILVHQIVSSSR